MAKKVIGGLFTVVVLLYFVTLVLHISANYANYQWDFRTHRKAAEIASSGKDPYDPDTLMKHEDASFLYTYPPVTLYFYKLFTFADYKSAFHIFLVSKCILLVGLIYFWQKAFLKQGTDPLFYLFCLLAFNSAVYRDLIAGNINLVEQVMLWLAFFFYLKRNLLLFCIFCLMAASFKMTPIFFLILLLLSNEQKKYSYFFGSAGAFIAYLLLQYILAPQLFSAFIRNALIVVGERGWVAPSTFTLVGNICQWFSKHGEVLVPRTIQLGVVLLIAAAVVFFTYKAYVRLQRMNHPYKEMISLFLVCLVYALIHPRFKDYAHMLLLLPAYYIIRNTRFTPAVPFVFFLTVLVYPPFILPGIDIIFKFFWKYYPLMIVYTIWGMYLYEIFSLSKNQNARG